MPDVIDTVDPDWVDAIEESALFGGQRVMARGEAVVLC